MTTSLVKRPSEASSPKEQEFFDKLVKISTTYDKTQHQEALKEIEDLRTASKAATGEGHNMKAFERELKRQENRHKMDLFDSGYLKKMDDHKKDGTDQV